MPIILQLNYYYLIYSDKLKKLNIFNYFVLYYTLHILLKSNVYSKTCNINTDIFIIIYIIYILIKIICTIYLVEMIPKSLLTILLNEVLSYLVKHIPSCFFCKQIVHLCKKH